MKSKLRDSSLLLCYHGRTFELDVVGKEILVGRGEREKIQDGGMAHQAKTQRRRDVVWLAKCRIGSGEARCKVSAPLAIDVASTS